MSLYNYTDDRTRLRVHFTDSEEFDADLSDTGSDAFSAYKLRVAQAITYNPYTTLPPLERPVILEILFRFVANQPYCYCLSRTAKHT